MSAPAAGVIDGPIRLSRSALWNWQRKYFDEQGLTAWQSGTVPHYVTSNPFLARAYAQVVIGWLRDQTRSGALDLNEPVYLLEVGAGPARFGYHFMRSFFDLLTQSSLAGLPVVYVLTDVVEATVAAWLDHPQLAAMLSAGRLDLARFDLEVEESVVELVVSGTTLRAGTVANPLAAIANYVFDTLPHDAFSLKAGRLQEQLIRLSAPEPLDDPGDPALLGQVAIDWVAGGLVADGYEEPEFLDVLRSYEGELDETSLLLPIGALRCLRKLRQLSGDRLLMIAGDKGYHRRSDLEQRVEPAVAVHGSISLPVNFHAIGRYVESAGGQFLTVDQHHRHLDVCAAIFGPADRERSAPTARFPESRLAYKLAIGQLSPDDFYVLKRPIVAALSDIEVDEIVSYLRLSGYDARVFRNCLPVLLTRASGLQTRRRDELLTVMHEVWENYFFIGEADEDVAFDLGTLAYALGANSDALAFFEHSMRLWGPDPSTRYNLAVNHAALGDTEAALVQLAGIGPLDFTYQPACELRAELSVTARHPDRPALLGGRGAELRP